MSINNILIPRVGIGVLLFNTKNQILLGRRLGSHGEGSYGPPGGHLEFGESLEECAIREVYEETNLKITAPKFLTTSNEVFAHEKKHYLSVFMSGIFPEGQIITNMEPEKKLSWEWIDADNLPTDLFLPLHSLTAKYELNMGSLIER
jgi:8-oxo-dGTP diphosphatase